MMESNGSLKHPRKVAVCNNWLMHGKCVRGEVCQYAHGINELEKHDRSKSGKNNTSSTIFSSGRRTICRFFQRGQCLRDDCKFVHEALSSDASDEPSDLTLTRNSCSRDEEDFLSNIIRKSRVGGGTEEADEGQTIRLMVLNLDKSSGLFFKIARSKPLGVLRHKLAERLNVNQNEVGLMFNSKVVTDNQTAVELELRNNDCLQSISIVNCMDEL